MNNKKSCPDCSNRLEITTKNGYCQCSKCRQWVLIENGEPIKAIPKDLI